MTVYENLLPRFLDYVKTETRSDPESTTIPSTASQKAFLQQLATELTSMGMSEVRYNSANGYVTAKLPSNQAKAVPTIGFLSHVDTADFNAVNVRPQIVKDYDGESIIKLDAAGQFVLDPAEFPNLKNYAGQTLVTTDGSTLLGADDKSGVAEIMTAMSYLIAHPEVHHGDLMVGFGPDEEIGTGADKFDVKAFNADFAYTVDGGPLGQLEYETFCAAALDVTIQGKNVHPGSATGVMVNALGLAVAFQNALPATEVPELTAGREGFFHLLSLEGTVEEAHMSYIIRDFERAGLERRKQLVRDIAAKLNEPFAEPRVKVALKDEYYNMIDVMKDHMDVVKLAEAAMKALNITPDEAPVRGGTDGSKISFMGLPTPNLFAGGENMHGRYEYVSVEVMAKAVDLILKISALNAE